ncbi:hypothetical protein [Oleisolibacter albus]|uniref:hypothetical protein n=1 Tax=Oleisolibacter albus TaxID=2171757 RepID=UPI0012D7C046|nr:hypothetical protein [Oleisolibacter albus]
MARMLRLYQYCGTLVLALVTAVAGLAAAWPALVRLPGDELVPSVLRFQPLSPAEIERFETSRRLGSASDQKQMGRLRLGQALVTSDPVLAVHLLDEAIGRLEQGLSAAPADTAAWAALAFARLRRSGPGDASLSALRLSISMAPAEATLVVWRVGLLLAHESLLGADDRQLLAQQIRAGWIFAPVQLVALLRQHGHLSLLHDQLTPPDLGQLARLLATPLP